MYNSVLEKMTFLEKEVSASFASLDGKTTQIIDELVSRIAAINLRDLINIVVFFHFFNNLSAEITYPAKAFSNDLLMVLDEFKSYFPRLPDQITAIKKLLATETPDYASLVNVAEKLFPKIIDELTEWIASVVKSPQDNVLSADIPKFIAFALLLDLLRSVKISAENVIVRFFLNKASKLMLAYVAIEKKLACFNPKALNILNQCLNATVDSCIYEDNISASIRSALSGAAQGENSEKSLQIKILTLLNDYPDEESWLFAAKVFMDPGEIEHTFAAQGKSADAKEIYPEFPGQVPLEMLILLYARLVLIKILKERDFEKSHFDSISPLFASVVGVYDTYEAITGFLKKYKADDPYRSIMHLKNSFYDVLSKIIEYKIHENTEILTAIKNWISNNLNIFPAKFTLSTFIDESEFEKLKLLVADRVYKITKINLLEIDYREFAFSQANIRLIKYALRELNTEKANALDAMLLIPVDSGSLVYLPLPADANRHRPWREIIEAFLGEQSLASSLAGPIKALFGDKKEIRCSLGEFLMKLEELKTRESWYGKAIAIANDINHQPGADVTAVKKPECAPFINYVYSLIFPHYCGITVLETPDTRASWENPGKVVIEIKLEIHGAIKDSSDSIFSEMVNYINKIAGLGCASYTLNTQEHLGNFLIFSGSMTLDVIGKVARLSPLVKGAWGIISISQLNSRFNEESTLNLCRRDKQAIDSRVFIGILIVLLANDDDVNIADFDKIHAILDAMRVPQDINDRGNSIVSYFEYRKTPLTINLAKLIDGRGIFKEYAIVLNNTEDAVFLHIHNSELFGNSFFNLLLKWVTNLQIKNPLALAALLTSANIKRGENAKNITTTISNLKGITSKLLDNDDVKNYDVFTLIDVFSRRRTEFIFSPDGQGLALLKNLESFLSIALEPDLNVDSLALSKLSIVRAPQQKMQPDQAAVANEFKSSLDFIIEKLKSLSANLDGYHLSFCANEIKIILEKFSSLKQYYDRPECETLMVEIYYGLVKIKFMCIQESLQPPSEAKTANHFKEIFSAFLSLLKNKHVLLEGLANVTGPEATPRNQPH